MAFIVPMSNTLLALVTKVLNKGKKFAAFCMKGKHGLATSVQAFYFCS
jgi:hypothetical protein